MRWEYGEPPDDESMSDVLCAGLTGAVLWFGCLFVARLVAGWILRVQGLI